MTRGCIAGKTGLDFRSELETEFWTLHNIDQVQWEVEKVGRTSVIFMHSLGQSRKRSQGFISEWRETTKRSRDRSLWTRQSCQVNREIKRIHSCPCLVEVKEQRHCFTHEDGIVRLCEVYNRAVWKANDDGLRTNLQ